MIHGKKVVVVLPAYNAERTLERTVAELPRDVVDEVLLIDDASHDSTVEVARSIGLPTLVHRSNLGYGGNQKTCYTAALAAGADVIVMVHPDYQYDPRLVPAMASLVASGVYDAVLGSRIIGNGALRGGMPRYKYLSNRLLTAFQNVLLGEKLSEYHTGYRAFSRRVLEALPLEANSDDFVFDNQILAQAFYFGYRIGEVSCPTRYQPESSSIDFGRSCRYGLGVLWTSLQYRAAKLGLARPRIFDSAGPYLHSERLGVRVTPPAASETADASSAGQGRYGRGGAQAAWGGSRRETTVAHVGPEQPADQAVADSGGVVATSGRPFDPLATGEGWTEPPNSPGCPEMRLRRRTWHRPALWCLVILLLVVSVWPAYLSWRLISAYAAIPGIPATSERDVTFSPPNVRPMSGAEGLVVAPNGAIFVADENPKRLLAFPDGTSASGFILGSENGPDKLQDPFGLAMGPDNTLYLLDRATGLVHLYRDGAYVRGMKLASPGAKALSVDEAGNIFIGDSGPQVVRKFLPSGQPDTSWGEGSSPGTTKVGEMGGIITVEGEVYTTVGDTVVRLDKDGRVRSRQRTISNIGMITASPDGRLLYAGDISTQRVWVLDRDGRPVGKVSSPEGDERIFFQPRGLAVTGDGHLYAVNENRVTVYRLKDPGGAG